MKLKESKLLEDNKRMGIDLQELQKHIESLMNNQEDADARCTTEVIEVNEFKLQLEQVQDENKNLKEELMKWKVESMDILRIDQQLSEEHELQVDLRSDTPLIFMIGIVQMFKRLRNVLFYIRFYFRLKFNIWKTLLRQRMDQIESLTRNKTTLKDQINTVYDTNHTLEDHNKVLENKLMDMEMEMEGVKLCELTWKDQVIDLQQGDMILRDDLKKVSSNHVVI